MCVSICLTQADEDIETLGDLVARFGREKLVWLPEFEPKEAEWESMDNDACFCGLDIERTALGLGYVAARDEAGDPMRYLWSKTGRK